jgi:thymidylate synthase
MQNYLDMLQKIMDEGYDTKNDRTGVGTRAIFGHQLKFDLKENFPMVTTKKVWFKGVVHELLWMISGSTNVKYLQDNQVKIWNEWADEDGDLGPVYGSQWRAWKSHEQATKLSGKVPKEIDQLQEVIDRIKENPNCRRLIVTAWNPAEVPVMNLPPCHFVYQFNVRNGELLDCHMNIRSWDTFLGGPFNIAQYALLTHMVAQVTGLRANELTISSGNTHIYSNHFEQVREQLTRKPLPLPKLVLNPAITDIDDFSYECVKLVDYEHLPAIKGEVAV